MNGIEKGARMVREEGVAGGQGSKQAEKFYGYRVNFSHKGGPIGWGRQSQGAGLASWRELLQGHISRAALGLALAGACLWSLSCSDRTEGAQGNVLTLGGAAEPSVVVREPAVSEALDPAVPGELQPAPQYPRDPAIPSFPLGMEETTAEMEESGLDDFRAITDSRLRKVRFFAFLRPLVETENKRLEAERKTLERLYEKFRRVGRINPTESAWLRERAAAYGLGDLPLPSEEVFRRLLRRIDSLPVELVLSQAAFESGWGCSRFAREGFNLFGEWCFEAGCGLVPLRREEGARHEVAVFDSPRRSVQSYMRNLNSHPAYQDLRLLRTQKRLQGERADGFTLASALMGYSEMGQEYVDSLCLIMRHNQSLMASERQGVAL